MDPFTYNRFWFYSDRSDMSTYGQPSGVEKTSGYDISEIKVFPRIIKRDNGYLLNKEIIYTDFDPAETYIAIGSNSNGPPVGQVLTKVFKMSEGVISGSGAETFSLVPGDMFCLFLDADIPVSGTPKRQSLFIGVFTVDEIAAESIEGRRASFTAVGHTNAYKNVQPFAGVREADLPGYSMTAMLNAILGSSSRYRLQNLSSVSVNAWPSNIRDKTTFELLEMIAGFYGTSFVEDDYFTFSATGCGIITPTLQITNTPWRAALNPVASGNLLTFTEGSLSDLSTWQASWPMSNPQRRTFSQFYDYFIPEQRNDNIAKLQVKFKLDGIDYESAYTKTLSPAVSSGIVHNIENEMILTDLVYASGRDVDTRANNHMTRYGQYHVLSNGVKMSFDMPGDPFIIPGAWYGVQEKIMTAFDPRKSNITYRTQRYLGMVTRTEYHPCGKTLIECSSIT